MKDLSNLILYRASAGSGKTYTLAKVYLKIVLLNPYDYNKILAVTFTKKATAEMKSRIIEYLTELEKKEPKLQSLKESIINEIKEEKGIDITDVFDKNVGTALQLILHDYSNFNISTIDSFFQSIIRAFAKELDLPIGMEVELDTENVIQHAVENTLKDYKTDKDDFSRWIEEYIFDLIDEDKSWKIEKNMHKLAKQLFNENYQLLTVNNAQQFDITTYKSTLTELKKIVYNYKNKMDKLVQQFESDVAQNEIDLTVYKGKKTYPSFVKKTKNYDPEFTPTIQKMIDTDEVLSAENSKNKEHKFLYEKNWSTIVKPFLLEIAAHQLDNDKQYNAAVAVLKNIYSLALLEIINNKIKDYKADNNLILISDTNQIVSLIARHEEIPFIFEKSANFLNYILLDEFQDTSLMQWSGILPLLLEVLQNINGLVLIVGDPKQSIYRWRGGKMELIIDGITKDLSSNWKERKELDKAEYKINRRSAIEIVQFNNAFFSAVKNEIHLENGLFTSVLADVQQGIFKTKLHGFIQCKWLEKNDGIEEAVQLTEISSIINSLVGIKKYKDIAILTRNNKHGILIANYLKSKNIPVVSAESLLLQNQLSIKLIITALEYVLYPTEDFYCIKLNYLFAKFLQKESLENYVQKHNKELYFFEEEIEILHRKNISKLSSIAINELLFLLLHALKIDAQTDNYILRFQDVVFKFAQTHSNATPDFLAHWEEQKNKLSILPPDGKNAVNILTIHKSKGLQFPVVIVPYADWSMKPKPEAAIWIKSEAPIFNQLNAFPVEMTKRIENSLFEQDFNNELQLNYIDNINLLYVAFTRAEEQLYILTTKEKNPKNEPLPDKVNKLLLAILPKLNLENSSCNDTIFTYGNPNAITPSESKPSKEIKLQPVLFHNFKTKIALASKKEYNSAQTKGNILHSILSKIDFPSQLQRAIATSTADAIDFYTTATQNVVTFFMEQDWYNPKWKHINEREMFFNQKLLRADKILLSEKDCIVIDYKTGAKEPSHHTQLQEYLQACAAILPQKIKGYLLYTDTLELVEININ